MELLLLELVLRLLEVEVADLSLDVDEGLGVTAGVDAAVALLAERNAHIRGCSIRSRDGASFTITRSCTRSQISHKSTLFGRRWRSSGGKLFQSVHISPNGKTYGRQKWLSRFRHFRNIAAVSRALTLKMSRFVREKET